MSDQFDDHELPEDDQWVSKTQLKQASKALHDLGKQLVDLPAATLADFPLDDELRTAVALAQKINRKKDGFRRQLQFIGKLLRHRETEAIATHLAQLEAKHRLANQHFHQLEHIRDSLLTTGDEALNALLAEHPHLDRQRLRQLIRQAQKQAKENKPPKSAREIFQYLKAEIDS